MVNSLDTLTSRKRAPLFSTLGLLLLVCGVSAAACGGVNDVNTGKSNKGGAGSGGGGNAAGTGATSTGGDTTTPGGAGNDPTPCKEGATQCAADGITVQTCNADATWEDTETCGGVKKVCTGKGVCAAYRLVNAGIDSFGVRPAEGPMYILKEQTLSAAPRTCNKAGLCVTGGIR